MRMWIGSSTGKVVRTDTFWPSSLKEVNHDTRAVPLQMKRESVKVICIIRRNVLKEFLNATG